ncbi:troponin T, skeletal muscle-like isoform X3 [Lineus longissimus]|uniref:troponin T, skeletal muscle-like isoform X3 n=1 Tax=Lineus longissimus TaxID=88925 RepID=UPI00315C9257
MSDDEGAGSDYEQREESPAPEPEAEEHHAAEEEAPKPKPPKPQPPAETGGKTEAEIMMEEKRRRDKEKMEAEIEEYKEQREEEIVKMNAEISELTEKIARRKVEREEEERRMAEAAMLEQQRRKAEDEERARKKREAEEKKRAEREAKQLEAEQSASQMGKRAFVITRKNKDGEAVQEVHSKDEVKSKEQLEAEKKAILAQRITPLGDVSNLDEAALKDKAKELHTVLFRLLSDNYDLEQHFKQRQYEMMELADRARQMNKGKKKFAVTQDASGQDKPDPMGEKYSGIPPKIQLCSKYERHKDRRNYVERKDVFSGPIYAEETPRILPGEGGAKPEGAGDDEEAED